MHPSLLPFQLPSSLPVTISSNSDWPTSEAVASKTFPVGALSIPAGTIKVDTLISGFDYASVNNRFSVKVSPQGTVLQNASSINNAYYDPGVTSSPFTSFFVQTGNNLTFPYVVNFDSSAVNGFSELIITLVVHSIAYPAGSQSPISSGFNTITVTRQTSYINLFNPIANKNNLGVLTAQRFYGFGEISIAPSTLPTFSPYGGIELQTIVNNPFNASIFSQSAVSTISASYYFYSNNADIICPTSNLASNSLIRSTYNNWICRATTTLIPNCQPYDTTQDTYSVSISTNNPASLYIDLATVVGTTYLITFNLLDGNAVFKTPQLTVKLGTQTVTRIVTTTTSPWRGAPIIGVPTDPQIQTLTNYAKFSVFVTATQSTSRLEFEFTETNSTTASTYYLKGVSMSSGNLIFDPLSQTCVQTCYNNQMISTNTIPNVCTSCSEQGRIYDASTGSCGCPLGTYFNSRTLSCVQCLEASCERCNANNSAICTSCPFNRILSGNRCACIQGYLEIDGACVQCNPGCTSCNGNPNICVSCIANTNRVQANGTCSCITGYYDSGQANCAICPPSCLTCVAAQAATPTPACSSCPINSNRVATPINNNCPCLEGYTERAVVSQTCQPCHFTCNRCTGPNSNQCIDCNINSGRVLTAQGTCICTTGLTELNLPYCVNGASCVTIPGCVECNNGVCSRCDSLQYKTYSTIDLRCVCINGYFPVTINAQNDFTCSPCALGCARCTAQGVCSQCYTGVANPTTCQCPVGSFADLTTQSCQPCTTGCQTCSSRSSCTACFAPLTPSNGFCVCPLGSYFFNNNCQPCPGNCQACNGTGQCVLCQTGSLLLPNGTCATSCPPQTYNNGYSCSRCSNSCLSCTGPSTCQACATGTILYYGLCLTTCPDGTVPTTTNPAQCVPCSSNCERCTGNPNVCTSCPSGQVLNNRVCTTFCSPGSVASGGSCLPCNGCETCFGTPQICTSCSAGFLVVFQTGQCVRTCPTGTFSQGRYCYATCPYGTYSNGQTCAYCNSNCLTCSNTATNCTSCNRNIPFLQFNGIQGKRCVSSCATGLTLNGIECQQCTTGCVSCYQNNPTSCDRCIEGYTAGGPGQIPGSVTCVARCLGNNFNNGTGCQPCPSTCSGCTNANTCIGCSSSAAVIVNGQCTSCVSPCATCQPGSATACTSCVGQTALSGSSCVTICPVDQENVSGFCRCRTGLVAYQSQCLATCPPLTTSVNNICQPCSAKCSTCSGSPTACTTCALGYILVGSNCVLSPTCAYGQVANPAIPSSCVNICPSNLFFFDTYCVSTCPTNYVPNTVRAGCVYANSSQERQCGPGLLYYNGLCLTSCPIGTLASFGSCVNCLANCAYCPSSSSCSSCMPGYYLSDTGSCILSTVCAPPQISFQGGCITSCPLGTYQQALSCNRICDVGTYFYQGLCYYQGCPNRLYRTEFACVATCPTGTTLNNNSVCVGNANTICPAASYLTQSGVCASCQTPCASCFGGATNCTACITGTLSGNTCTNIPGNNTGGVGITIQSSSIYNNRVQVRLVLSNLPANLTQLQQNQLLNVVVYPNTFPAPQVYQWIDAAGSNIVNVVVIFPGAINPNSLIYFSVNIPAVGSLFNQQGITNFANANIQLPLANVPQASAQFAVPNYVSAIAAQQAVSQSAN